MQVHGLCSPLVSNRLSPPRRTLVSISSNVRTNCLHNAQDKQSATPCQTATDIRNPPSSRARLGVAAAVLVMGTAFLPWWSAGNAYAKHSVLDPGDALVGKPRIIDGDTLVIGSEKVRLFGVDAPETKQSCKDKQGQPYACGEAATSALTQKIGSASIECRVRAKDMYQRNVSSCYLEGTGDLGDWMVENGHAVAYRAFSKDYVKDEDLAKKAQKGIWQGEFQEPAAWRKENKGKKVADEGKQATSSSEGVLAMLPNARMNSQQSPSSGCNVKGNISSQGARIYHVPGGRYYEAVKIEPSKGEAFFCSEQEAEQAGFRKSRE